MRFLRQALLTITPQKRKGGGVGEREREKERGRGHIGKGERKAGTYISYKLVFKKPDCRLGRRYPSAALQEGISSCFFQFGKSIAGDRNPQSL